MARLSDARYYKKIFKDKIKELEENEHITFDIKEYAKDYAIREHNEDMYWKTIIDEKWDEFFGVSHFEKGWFFLTIRPHNDFKNFNKFFYLTKRILSRKIIEKFKVVFEQKGESKSEIGKGFHFHALLKLSSPSKGKKFFINEFMRDVYKEGLSDVIANNCIDLKPIYDQLGYDTRERYINTEEFQKGDDKKLKAWEFDKPWRTSMKLETSYSSMEELEKRQAPLLPSHLKSMLGTATNKT